MAHSDQAERIAVLDSEGVRGTLAADAMQHPDGQVLITFDQGRRVQAPQEILIRRDDGSYYLPLSLRDLSDETLTLQRASDGSVVAVIPVVVEEAQIAKRPIETGRVRISKAVHTTEEQIDVPLLRTKVQVERVPVERYVEEPATPHYEAETLVIPVMEEVLVIQKRLLVREEIRITTVSEQVQHQETVTLQREQVTVKRDKPDPEGPANP